MKITIEIECDNAAFEPHPQTEMSRILKDLAKLIQIKSLSGIDGLKLRDYNGNTVGTVAVDEENPK